MEIERMWTHPQPYSKPLRTIATILAERSSDAEAIQDIQRFLELCQVRPYPPSRREQ